MKNNIKPSRKILLVDDDEEDREFFVETIASINNATMLAVASNGIEALNTLNNISTLPDLIFLDINMPLMDGIECLATIKKTPLIQSIPIFMLSSSKRDENRVKQMGAKGFITKSGDLTFLYDQLERIINPVAVVDKKVKSHVLKSMKINLN